MSRFNFSTLVKRVRTDPGSVSLGYTGKTTGIAISCIQAVDPSNPNCQILWLTNNNSSSWSAVTFLKSVLKNMVNSNSTPALDATINNEKHTNVNGITLEVWEPLPVSTFKYRFRGIMRQVRFVKKRNYPTAHIVVVSAEYLLEILTGKDRHGKDIVYDADSDNEQIEDRNQQASHRNKTIKPQQINKKESSSISNIFSNVIKSIRQRFTSTTIHPEALTVKPIVKASIDTENRFEKTIKTEKSENAKDYLTGVKNVKSKLNLESLKLLVVETLHSTYWNKQLLIEVMHHIQQLHTTYELPSDMSDIANMPSSVLLPHPRRYSIIGSCNSLNENVIMNCFKVLGMKMNKPNDVEQGYIHTSSINLMEPYGTPTGKRAATSSVGNTGLNISSGLSSSMTLQSILSLLYYIPVELRAIILCYYSSVLNDDNIIQAVELWCTRGSCITKVVPNTGIVETAFNTIDIHRDQAMLRYGSHISYWDTSLVTNMSHLFHQHFDFNDNINNWDTSNVTDMTYMFSQATSFNQPLNRWNVSQVESMVGMFYQASSFNQPLEDWDVSNTIAMKHLFHKAVSFNQPLAKWDMRNVVWLMDAFGYALSFNQPLDSWHLHNAVSLSGMFQYAIQFNQPLSNWRLGQEKGVSCAVIKSMSGMFRGALSFNGDVSGWRLRGVQDISEMFADAISFNQSLKNWNIGIVKAKGKFLDGAIAFDHTTNDC